ncbi:hypothetical protein EIP86_006392, partial [Pleurotus ostreatoroseus]
MSATSYTLGSVLPAIQDAVLDMCFSTRGFVYETEIVAGVVERRLGLTPGILLDDRFKPSVTRIIRRTLDTPVTRMLQIPTIVDVDMDAVRAVTHRYLQEQQRLGDLGDTHRPVVRREIEAALRIVYGVLDNEPFRTQVREAILSSFNRVYTILDYPEMHVRALPIDLYRDVAKHLGDPEDLRNLSLANSAFRDAAQSQLFRAVNYVIPRTQALTWLDYVAESLANPSVQRFVKELTLVGIRHHPHPTISKSTVVRLLKLLPNLTKLQLRYFTWAPDSFVAESTPPSPSPSSSSAQHPPPQTYVHAKMSACLLQNIIIASPTTSPLEVLSMARSWDVVELDSLFHSVHTNDILRFQVPVNRLQIWQSVLHETTYTFPRGPSIVSRLVSLSIHYANHLHPSIVENLIRNSTQTLKSLRINLHCADTFGDLTQWVGALRPLLACDTFTTLSLTVPLTGPWASTNPEIATILANGAFVNAVVDCLPSCTRCVQLYFPIDATHPEDGPTTFHGVGWELVGRRINSIPSIRVLTIELGTHELEGVVWLPKQYNFLQRAFPRLGYHC